MDTVDFEDDTEPKDLGLVGLTQVKTVGYAGGVQKGHCAPTCPLPVTSREKRASKSSTDLSAVLRVVGLISRTALGI